ncbi:MAG: YkgJ family cysteine cluster protein [Desulfobulbales bacterium]|nr:YkgJ family cysteine cluster protein [Desulfobulbales bacterium]
MNNRMKPENGAAQCQGCGTCCRRGGPTLHLDDINLAERGIIGVGELVTIRRNEPAYNPVRGKVLPSASEFIKIKGRGNTWSCLFFAEEGNCCAVYRDRPLECRLLFCRDTGPLTEVIGEHLLTRRALLADDDPVLDLLERHEEECSYGPVNDLLAGGEKVRDDIEARLTAQVGRDLAVRDCFLRTYPKRGAEELFLFGRPLFLVLAPHGFRLVEDNSRISLVQSAS